MRHRDRDRDDLIPERLLHHLLEQRQQLMDDLSVLNANVAANTEAVNAAVVALGQSGGNQPAIDAAAATIATNTAALAAATPAGVVVPPVDVPPVA